MPWRNSPWMTFILERFPPFTTVSMILLFVIADGMLASHLMQVHSPWYMYVPAFFLALSFFFRLRLFDEIKDYEVDLQINPTRPLARGVLTVQQVWKADMGLIVFEIILAGFVSRYALMAQLVAIGYSLLMYKEFFIGRWLRPKLTTYAVTHTFVSTLIAYAIAVVVVSKPAWAFPPSFLWAGLMFWCIFNLFEFSRKTFAPSEERSGVDSYSSLFGVAGGVALSLSQVFISYAILFYFFGLNEMTLAFIIFMCVTGAGIIYKPKASLAKVFRLMCGIYILLFFGGIIAHLVD
jgi:4-hydroxybenzoate polyprenyltransferase